MLTKFRAFWKSENKMIEVHWIRFDEQWVLGKSDGQTILPLDFSYVDLMPSIGRIDKNDKEIFEGDIVADKIQVLYEVRYNRDFCAFFLYPLKNPEKFTGIYPGMEPEIIIGNIYENQELKEK